MPPPRLTAQGPNFFTASSFRIYDELSYNFLSYFEKLKKLYMENGKAA